MRRLAVLVLLLWPAAVSAQVVQFIDAQGHWKPANAMGGLGHTHIGCTPPASFETTTAAFTLECKIQLFHVSGSIGRIEGHFISKMVWAATGTEVGPPLVGDPTGLKVFPVSVTFDPKRSDAGTPDSGLVFTPKHGWWVASISVVTFFFNGDTGITQLWLPMLSKLDPSQPLAGAPTLQARYIPGSPRSEQSGFGIHVAEFRNSYAPILTPLTAPVTQTVIASAYGLSGNLGVGTFQYLADLDLHNNVPGRVLQTSHSHGGNPNGEQVTFDPVVLGAGAHKVALTWDQVTDATMPGFEPGQEATVLLVFTMNVGPGAPPSEVCGDGIDNDGDGQIDEDCAPPPPPPPPATVWSVIPTTMQRNGDQIRVCASDGRCLILGGLIP